MSRKNPRGRKSVALYKSELDDVEKLHVKATAVTEESVDSTRRMVNLVNECQDAGINTLMMLNQQGESLNRTEAGLDQVDNNLKEGDTTLKNIENMEKVPCICLPCYLCFKSRKKKASVAKSKTNGTNDKTTETVQPENSPTFTSSTVNTASSVVKNQTASSRKKNNTGQGDFINSRRFSSSNRPQLPSERYFQKITGGKEEDEIEDNLTHVSSHLSDLKQTAIQMGSTVEHHNEQLGRMNIRTEIQTSKISDLNRRTSKLINNNNSSETIVPSSPCACPCLF